MKSGTHVALAMLACAVTMAAEATAQIPDQYAHRGYESRYERYLLLHTDKEKIKSSTFTSGSPKPGMPTQ